MADFEISDFRGRLPAISKTELPNNYAQQADNIRIQGKELSCGLGALDSTLRVTGTAVKTIFRYTDAIWLEWNQDVDVVRSAVANDSWDRVLWTLASGVPQISSNDVVSSGAAPHPDVSYDLGVPPPVGAPSALVTGTATNPDDLPDTRFYVCTMVDKYGAEGVPTSPSNEVEWRAGQTCTVTLPTVPSGNWVFTAINIYRTNTGSGGTEFQKVASVSTALGGTGWVDSVASDYLGDVLESADFDEPVSTMRGLVTLPNGYHAGFFENTLCFSEPGYPHAWPIKYRLPIKDFAIVGLGVVGDTVVVMTTGKPYLAVGTHPQSTALAELNVTQGCLSKRGIVSIGYAVLYPGPDGMIMVTNEGASNITRGLFTRKQWQALVPSSFYCSVIDGLVAVFYSTGAVAQVFLFDPQHIDAGVVDMPQLFTQANYYDEDEDTLYGVGGGTNVIYKVWDEAAQGPTPVWRSKVVESFQAMSPGVARVLSAAYPVTFKLYADGSLVHTEVVANNDFFRINADSVLTDRFEVELSVLPFGSGVYRVVVGENIDDLF